MSRSPIAQKQTFNTVHFLFEISALKRLQRTGWQILGSGGESVAEHSYMVAMISYMLAEQTGADIQKTLLMALFHDVEETRTGDVYRLAKLYVTLKKRKARTDTLQQLPQRNRIEKLLDEYDQRKTLEAKIVKDADNLSLCLELKMRIEEGNTHAQEWLDANIDALQLTESKDLGKVLLKTDSQEWWRKERKILHAKR